MTAASNRELPISLLVVGGLLVAIAMLFLFIFNVPANGVGKNMDRVLAAADDELLQRIRPVVTLDDILGAEKSAMEAVPGESFVKSPVELYNTACLVCHASGVAGAPKLGDKAAWQPRMVNGIDGLLSTAIQGKGAMPPRGGSAYSDDELRQIIEHMLVDTGLTEGGSST